MHFRVGGAHKRQRQLVESKINLGYQTYICAASNMFKFYFRDMPIDLHVF